MVKKHCCDTMREKVEHACFIHVIPFDCPDYIVHYFEKFNEYGIVIHNGGMSTVSISFCPWCGTKLPDSSRGKTDN